MDPTFLGRIQCFNLNQQCYAGEENAFKLMSDQALENAFEGACQELNTAQDPEQESARTINSTTSPDTFRVQSQLIRCCPRRLINRLYYPTPGQMPIHVKGDSRGNFESCPESVSSGCIRTENEEDFQLCVAGKCNDAGYLEAQNMYQVCKAYKPKGKIEEVPDCPERKCEKMLKVPEFYRKQLNQSQLDYQVKPQTLLSDPLQPTNRTGLLQVPDLIGNLSDEFYQSALWFFAGLLILVIIIGVIFYFRTSTRPTTNFSP